jgi:hypothetical protein
MTILLEMAAKQLKAAYQTIIEEITPFLEHQDSSVREMAEWAISKLNKHDQEDAPANLVNLIEQAKDLEDVTQDWSIYEEVWEETYAQGNREFRRRAIQVGQDLVKELYQSVKDKGELKRSYEMITVIPFFNRMTAGGFDSPAPYITTPRWGYTHPWNWSAYAHEVGHHIYRNVVGLQDELKVTIAHHLLAQGYDYSMASLWYNWLEEIFADLFALLQMGPAFAKTQQYVVLSTLPRKAIRYMLIRGQPTDILRYAYDFTHPVPHLRVYLTCKALEMSNLADKTTLDDLKSRWNSLFNTDDFFDKEKIGNLFVQTFKLGDNNKILEVDSEKPYDPQELAKIGDQVLEVIFRTELYSLKDAEKNLENNDAKKSLGNIEEVFKRTLPSLPQEEAEITQASADIELRDMVRWATDHFENKDVDSLNNFSKKIINHYRPDPTLPIQFTIYTAQQDDTIKKIAKEVYGDENQYELIRAANNLKRGIIYSVGVFHLS